MTKPPTIAYYVSDHGFGHGVRSCDIMRALQRLSPEVSIIIVTTLEANRLTGWLRADTRPSVRSGRFDVGMVQRDSIRVDVAATLERIDRVYERGEELIAQERRFLEREQVDAVVVDVPALPLEAAARSGIPRLAVGNFGWDWIYSAFRERDVRWGQLIEQIARGYSRADLLLRLPFAEPMGAFANQQDIPLVATPGADRRLQLAERTGADPNRRWVLLSFAALDWDREILDRVEKLSGEYELFVMEPLSWRRRNLHPLESRSIAFPDLVASVDIVVSKPGFGIVSDCAVNRKPLLYVDRSDFLEYAILVAAIERHLQHLHLPAEDLYRGELRNALEAVEAADAPMVEADSGGDEVAARVILGAAGISGEHQTR